MFIEEVPSTYIRMVNPFPVFNKDSLDKMLHHAKYYF